MDRFKSRFLVVSVFLAACAPPVSLSLHPAGKLAEIAARGSLSIATDSNNMLQSRLSISPMWA